MKVILSRSLAALLLSLSSCAALGFIHDVASVVTQVTDVLDLVQTAVSERQDQDPAKARLVLQAIREARIAADAVNAVAHSADSADNGQYLAAVDALMDAVHSVYQLARDFGVTQMRRGTVSAQQVSAGVTPVPPEPELRASLLDPSGGSR